VTEAAQNDPEETMLKTTILLSIALAVAVSTSADAAKKKHHHHAAAAMTVGSTGGSPGMDATDAQRTKFFQDAFFPLGAK
jgi:Spy/CpxP family protein refolding chaperone